MSWNTFGRVFRFTTWGESHGPAIGVVVDGCPPGIALTEEDIQPWLDRRKPGQSKFTTQRREPDQVRILSGVFEGKTTAKELAKLETPLSDKELCVAAAFLEEEIATPPSIAEAAEEAKKQNEALYGASEKGEMGKFKAAIAAGAEVDWHNPLKVSELSELE